MHGIGEHWLARIERSRERRRGSMLLQQVREGALRGGWFWCHRRTFSLRFFFGHQKVCVQYTSHDFETPQPRRVLCVNA